MQKSVFILIMLIFLLNICTNANPFLKKHYSQFKDSLDELEEKNFDNALSKIDNAIITAEKDNLPDSDILRYNRGIFNIIGGKPDNAIVDFETSLKSGIYNDNLKSKIYYNIGNSYLSKSDFKKALQNYIESYKIDPENRDLLKNMNYAVRMLKNPQSQDENGENDEEHNDENKGNEQNKQIQQKKSQSDTKSQDNDEKNKEDEDEQSKQSQEQKEQENNKNDSSGQNGDEQKNDHSVNEVIQLGNNQEKEAMKQYILKELDYKEEHNEKDW